MGFQRNTKKINMGLATGKEKRGRAKRKPQISVRKISQAGSKSEPSIRVGASQDLPITLDSDDDAPARTPLRSDTSTPCGTQSRAKPLTECKHGDKNMSLLDIDDFIMRSKVAQLMVVAPALAVIDLYHLIIDSEGDLPRARKQAIRMSEAPTIRYRHGLDEEGDGIMVKIDPNDPAFEWDDDEPYSEFDTATAARPSKPTLKATRSRIVKGSTRATESTKSNTKNRSNVGAKRAKSTFTNPTHARETSSDRDFIVPDNVIHYDLDSDV
ncbi:unnamed protein product [Alternaria alternata]